MSDVIIRPIRREDAEDLYEMWRDPAVCRTTLQLPSQEMWLTEQRLDETNQHLHRFVAEVDGRVVGSIVISQNTRPRLMHSGRLGMMVHPGYWGRGIGSRLLETVLDLADNWLDLKRVELEVNTDNPAAIHIYKKFGFEIEGTKRRQSYGDGRWADTHFMARLRFPDTP